MIPTPELLRALKAKGHNLVPVWKERLADTETPVSAYLKLVADDEPDHSFLLESVAGGEHVARWSFLGRDPWLVFRSRGKAWTVAGEREESGAGDPLAALRQILSKLSPAELDGIPALAGAVGFNSYDSVRLVENIPDTGTCDVDLDDLHYGFYRDGVIFDNRRHRILVWSFAMLDGVSEETALEAAMARITRLEERLDLPLRKSGLDVAREPGEVTSNFTKDETLVVLALWRIYDEERMARPSQVVVLDANALDARLKLYFEAIEPPQPTQLDRILAKLRRKKLIRYQRDEEHFGQSQLEILPTLPRVIPFEDATAWEQQVALFNQGKQEEGEGEGMESAVNSLA